MNNKYWILVILFILILPLGESATLGQAPQGQCISLTQTCGNCTFINITSITYPNQTKSNAVPPFSMTKYGPDFNYTYCLTNTIGTYTYNTFGDPDGILMTQPVTFEITPSGDSGITSGQGIVLLGSLIIILILSSIFMIAGILTNNTPGKIALIVMASIGFFVSILYVMVIMTQYIGQNPTVVQGYETFLFVVKIVGYIGFTALIIMVFLVMLKAWKIKRGLAD